MERLSQFFDWLVEVIRPLAEQLGAPGLAIVAFFDSSFLSLPEVADGLLVLAVLHRPELWAYYAAATTVGSIGGCYALFVVARRGGEAFLRKRIRAVHIERGLSIFRRYGLLAIVVPSILPPPMPFKIFVLLSGIAKVRVGSFLLAVAIGRGFRYGGEAWLAYFYGEQATQYIRENLPIISVWIAAGVAVPGIAVIVVRRRRARA